MIVLKFEGKSFSKSRKILEKHSVFMQKSRKIMDFHEIAYSTMHQKHLEFLYTQFIGYWTLGCSVKFEANRLLQQGVTRVERSQKLMIFGPCWIWWKTWISFEIPVFNVFHKIFQLQTNANWSQLLLWGTITLQHT